MSGVQRYCPWGDHWVDAREAAEVGGAEPISGPGIPRYACWPHVYEHSLRTAGVPSGAPADAWIGRRDAAPLAPRGRQQ